MLTYWFQLEIEVENHYFLKNYNLELNKAIICNSNIRFSLLESLLTLLFCYSSLTYRYYTFA